MNKSFEYLGDTTNNDALVIKECAKLVKKYYEEGKDIDKEFVKKTINIYLENEVPMIRNIYFVNRVNSSTAAEYSFVSHNLYFDMNVINHMNRFYSKCIDRWHKFNNGDKMICKFYTFLLTIFHELTHAKQFYLARENKGAYPIYEYCDDVCLYDYKLYKKIYNIYPIERYADTRGSYLSYKIIDRAFKGNKDMDAYKALSLYTLYRGYDPNNQEKVFDGPYDTLKKECASRKGFEFNYEFPSDINEYDVYDKMHVGFPITREEYRVYSREFTKLIK